MNGTGTSIEWLVEGGQTCCLVANLGEESGTSKRSVDTGLVHDVVHVVDVIVWEVVLHDGAELVFRHAVVVGRRRTSVDDSRSSASVAALTRCATLQPARSAADVKGPRAALSVAIASGLTIFGAAGVLRLSTEFTSDAVGLHLDGSILCVSVSVVVVVIVVVAAVLSAPVTAVFTTSSTVTPLRTAESSGTTTVLSSHEGARE